MLVPFYFLFVFFSFFTVALSPQEEYQSFLKHERKQKQFENRQKNILQARLKELKKSKNQKQLLKSQKSFLEHEKRKEEFEKKRKSGFLIYKRQYKKHEQRRKSILKVRLKVLEDVRKQERKSKGIKKKSLSLSFRTNKFSP